jgi:phosphate transport system ATP-binding protein
LSQRRSGPPQRGRIAIVMVTHNLQQASRVPQNCAFFLATDRTPGHVVKSGPTGQVFGAPSDPRAADYVQGRFG